MKTTWWNTALRLALAACMVLAAQGPAFADADSQAKRQVDQPLNNAPVWRDVRSGEPAVTSVKGRETNVLVQPQGETWRQLHNGPLVFYGGALILVVACALGAFYSWKGQIKLHEKPTGKLIERFNDMERLTHWTVAISFVILAVSGLVMLFGKYFLLPLIGYSLFGYFGILCKTLHNFVGPIFIISLVPMVYVFIRDNLPKLYDLKWLAKGGGLASGEHVPSGRFNAGEKIWFWGGVLLLGILVSLSGLVLDFPNFDQTRSMMQDANIIHATVAVLFMSAALGHIYLGTIGMEGAYESMRHGHVDETWAREHHEYWYDDVKAGKAPQRSVSVAGEPATERSGR